MDIISWLYTEVNIKAQETKQPPVSYDNFLTILLTLESKGLVNLTDNNTVYSEAVKKLEHIREKMKEG